MLTHHAFRVAALFVVAGAASRFTFRHFESRWQIAIFWGLVLVYQCVLRPLAGKDVSLASTALDLAGVAAAIVAVKVAVEGLL